MSEPNIELANSIAKNKSENITPDGNIVSLNNNTPTEPIVKEPEIKTEEIVQTEEKKEDTSLFDAFLMLLS